MLQTRKRFAKVNIEISNICNLQCSFCPEVVRENKMMSVSLFERVISQVAPLTELVCFHLMGEPLGHPQLKEMVNICADHKVKIFFVSNGVLLRDDKIELLLNPAVQQVNFSLHSFLDNFPGKNPSLYLEKIFKFTERAFAERPELYINYRVWSLKESASSNLGHEAILNKICERFDFKLPDIVNVRKRKSLKIKNKLYFHFDTEFVWPGLDLPVLGASGTCHGLSSHFGVLADGRVVPCCLDKEAAIVLGNIADQSIEEILSSPRATKILKGFKERKLHEDLCQRCQYIERFSGSLKKPAPELSHAVES